LSDLPRWSGHVHGSYCRQLAERKRATEALLNATYCMNKIV